MYRNFAELLLAAFDIELITSEEIEAMVRELNPEERRALRRALERIDSILDDLIIEKRLERLKLNRDETHSGNG